MAAPALRATAVLLEMSDKTRGPELIPAMRQAALALHRLVQSRFSGDALYLVPFSYLAQDVPAEQLAQHTWLGGQTWAVGANMQHALTVARDVLGPHRAASREVIMLTSGIPTAHGAGESVAVSYPPSQRTITETLSAMAACAADRIDLLLYVLTRPAEARTFGGAALVRDPERDAQATRFIDQVETSGHGHVTRVAAGDLESAIIAHYLHDRGGPSARA